MKLSILMCVYNLPEITKQCIDTIFQYTSDFELLVYDNASNEQTKSMLNTYASRSNFKLITATENSGFIKGQNTLAAIAQGDILCIFNNDVIIKGDWTSKAYSEFSKDPTIALIGPSAGRYAKNGPRLVNSQYNWIEGWCMFYPKHLYQQFGLFDDKNFAYAYCEDVDLSLRLQYAGYKILLVSLPMQHLRSKTSCNVDFGTRHINEARIQEKWKHFLPNS